MFIDQKHAMQNNRRHSGGLFEQKGDKRAGSGSYDKYLVPHFLKVSLECHKGVGGIDISRHAVARRCHLSGEPGLNLRSSA